MEWEHREDLISDAWAPLVMISFRQMKAYFGRHEISCPTSSEWRSQNANKGLAHVRVGGGLLGGGSVRDKTCCCGVVLNVEACLLASWVLQLQTGRKSLISVSVSLSLYLYLCISFSQYLCV